MSLKDKYTALLQEARNIADVAVTEDRAFTEDEKVRIEKMLEDVKQMKADHQMHQQIATLEDLAEVKENSKRIISGSIADQFLSNPAYKAWYKSVAPSGYIPESRKGLVSPSVELKTLGLFKKDLITGVDSTSAGAFVVPQDTGLYEGIGRFPTVLRDLISVRQTVSDAVEFVRQTTQVTQAAPTQESNVTDYTAYTGEIEGKKPEGAMTFERVNEPVKTIAVWIPATKRALSDAAQIRGIIDQELREDLADELENQLFNGTGTGENFTGIANQAGTLLEQYDTDIITTTRQALTTLRVTGRVNPTAWVFNPTDWESVELLQDGNNHFYYGGPIAAGPKTLWGVPVVESFHVTSGSAWLANWRKAVLWDREQTTISVSDSHSDFFIRNMVAILAEMRAAFGLIKPSAFIEVELS
jgi:HK97 family phage major capsid protein